MKCFGLFFLLFILSSCTKPVSNDLANNAINQATALEQSLSSDCATESIKTQIKGIKSEINAITKACNTEKAEIRADKVKWQTAFWALFVVISVFGLRKVIK